MTSDMSTNGNEEFKLVPNSPDTVTTTTTTLQVPFASSSPTNAITTNSNNLQLSPVTNENNESTLTFSPRIIDGVGVNQTTALTPQSDSLAVFSPRTARTISLDGNDGNVSIVNGIEPGGGMVWNEGVADILYASFSFSFSFFFFLLVTDDFAKN